MHALPDDPEPVVAAPWILAAPWRRVAPFGLAARSVLALMPAVARELVAQLHPPANR